MKEKIVLALTLLVLPLVAYSYQYEMGAELSRDDISVNEIKLGSIDTSKFGVTFYFNDVDVEGSPLDKRAFMSRVSSVSAFFSQGKDDITINGGNLAIDPIAALAGMKQLNNFIKSTDKFNTILTARNVDINSVNTLLTDIPLINVNSSLLKNFGGVDTEAESDQFGFSSKVIIGSYILELSYFDKTTTFSNQNDIDEKQWHLGLGAYIGDATTLTYRYEKSEKKGTTDLLSNVLVPAFDLSMAAINQFIFDESTIIVGLDLTDTLTPASPGQASKAIPLETLDTLSALVLNSDDVEKSTTSVTLSHLAEIDSGDYIAGDVSLSYIDNSLGLSDGIEMFGNIDYFFNKKYSIGFSVKMNQAGANGIDSNTVELKTKYFISQNFAVTAKASRREYGDLEIDRKTILIDDVENFSIALSGTF